MTKLFTYIPLFFLAGLLISCSQVLQTVDLNINSDDPSMQEEFNVVEKTLTIKEAKTQKTAPYPRVVIKSGRGETAGPIPEQLALKSAYPKNNLPIRYKIGTGDTITFSKLIDNNQSPYSKSTAWPKQKVATEYKLGIGDTLALILMKSENSFEQMAPISRGNADNGIGDQNLFINSQQSDSTVNTTGRIGSDGSVLLLDVGRLEANGKSLNDLRSEVRNILIRNGVSPRFQLEIVEFKSQKSYLTVNSTNSTSQVIFLNDQRTTMRDILTSAGIGPKPGVITRIKLQRRSNEFYISLRDLYDNNLNNIDIEKNDHVFVEDSSANMRATSSTVDHEGNIVLESVGKVRAEGLTLTELKNNIKNLMQPVPDSQNAFQIQITNFASQKASLTPQGGPSVLIQITDTPANLSEVLTQNGVSIDVNNITQISLQRDGQTYEFSLDDLLASDGPKIYLQPEDHISSQVLPYKENKVFILGGVSPQIFKINPANRETLADVLFTSGGVLNSSSAKRSEVYLLRGTNPVMAYHLDAQSPTRLIVADAMELRPNDILYVAEQPIVSFNRTLATVVPLRILLRDIQDENIP